MRSTRATSIGYGTERISVHRKATQLSPRIAPLQDTSRNNPSPGEYNIAQSGFMKEYPILIRSRREFYYSNEIKNSNPTESPQRYRPKIECVMDSRFKKIGIGYGSKSMPYNKDALSYPGVGRYNLHNIFDRKYYKKIPIN